MTETNTGADEMNERPQKIIDAKFPLTWLIGATVTIVVSMATFYGKVDGMASKQAELQTSIDKLQEKIEKRDESMSVIQGNILQLQGKEALQDSSIQRTQADIVDLRRDFDDMRKNTRGIYR